MGNAVLSYINRGDLSTAAITTDSEVTSLPASNLTVSRLFNVWRTQATSAFVAYDLGASYPLGTFGLFGFPIGATDTVRLRVSNVSPGGGDVIDTTALASGVVEGCNQWVYVHASDASARYVRWDINAASLVGQGYFDAGRAWMGPTFRPSYNYSWGAQERFVDGSIVRTAPLSGVEYVDERWQRRRLLLEFGWVTDTEARDQIREIQRLVGIRNQLLFVPDPDSSRFKSEALLGRMTEVSPLTHLHVDIWSTLFEILESK